MSYNATLSDVSPLEPGPRIAVIVTGIIGTVSTTSVFLLLLHLFSVSFLSSRGSSNKQERIFLRMHLGAFVVCLLLSDLVQGISGIMQFDWARRGAVVAGPLCTAQGAMLLFGDNGTAFWNAFVAIHTFWTVVLGKRMSTLAVAFLIAAGWTACVILTVIGPLAIQTEAKGPFYGSTGAWCFVTTAYKDWRVYLHYLPMFISGFIITVLYVLVALVLFGVLQVDGGKWRFKAPPRTSFRNFFSQFSWNRLHRAPTGPTTLSHSLSVSSVGNGINSVNGPRRPLGSIRLGSIPRKTDGGSSGGVIRSHIEVPDEAAVAATVQSVDIHARPETGTTATSSYPDRGRPSTAKTIVDQDYRVEKVEIKGPAGNHQASMTTMNVAPVSGKGLQLKALAIKMLWYPIVYLVLIMPIAVTRVDSNLVVSPNVMLGFVCLLWLMGTANTVIYVCTRRLGPTPWNRRTLSVSRSRSKATRAQEATNVPTVAPVQIRVDRYTQHATDEQFVEIAREKSNNSSDANIPIVSSAAILHRDSTDSRDNKVDFDFGAMPRHVSRQGSLSNSTNAARPTHSYSLPRQHNQQPSYHEPHPYARSQSPTRAQSAQSHSIPTPFSPYYYEDDEESLRTHSRGHSRQNSSGIGKPMAF